jgi:hypothetical protein
LSCRVLLRQGTSVQRLAKLAPQRRAC